MKKIIAYRWFGGRTTIGIVVYQNDIKVLKAVMTSVPGHNEAIDIETIVDHGSKVSKEVAIAAIDDGLGTVKYQKLWAEYKATVAGPRISLNSSDFQILVSGGEIRYGTAKIILQDIGWDLMLRSINAEIDKDE